MVAEHSGFFLNRERKIYRKETRADNSNNFFSMRGSYILNAYVQSLSQRLFLGPIDNVRINSNISVAKKEMVHTFFVVVV